MMQPQFSMRRYTPVVDVCFGGVGLDSFALPSP